MFHIRACGSRSSHLALCHVLRSDLVHFRRDEILQVHDLGFLCLDHDIGPVHVGVGSENRLLPLGHLLLDLIQFLLLLLGRRLMYFHSAFFAATSELGATRLLFSSLTFWITVLGLR